MWLCGGSWRVMAPMEVARPTPLGREARASPHSCPPDAGINHSEVGGGIFGDETELPRGQGALNEAFAGVSTSGREPRVVI